MRSHGNVSEAECEKFNKCDNKKFVMTCKFCCKNNNNGVHEAHENFTFFVSKPCMEFQYKNSLLISIEMDFSFEDFSVDFTGVFS